MDQKIRDRLRAGESAAFGELFDEYAQAVYHHGYRLTGDRSLAEDVLSATFLQAWRLHRRIDLGPVTPALAKTQRSARSS